MNARHATYALLSAAMLGLAGCGGGGGSSESPPEDVVATAGDARVTLSYSPVNGVEYWAFIASFSNLTRSNAEQILTDVDEPQEICGLSNGIQYWFALNGRSNSGEGGTLSTIVTATPRAAGNSWSSLASPSGVSFNSLGFTYTDYCRSYDYDLINSLPGDGFLVGVGAGGLLEVSDDNGATWTAGSLPSGFSTDLYAVGGYTEYPSYSNLSDKNVRLVAVGAQGVALYSEDGTSWSEERSASADQSNLNAVGHSGTTIVAVGDSGTILSTTDGKSWKSRTSNTTANLYGVATGSGIYVAVGVNGTLLTTSSVSSWDKQTSPTTSTLRSVTYGNFNYSNDEGYSSDAVRIDTYVAVGDNGAVITSTNGGGDWQLVTPFTSNNLISVAYTTRFVAMDSAGNSWTSTDGLSWSGPYTSGLSSVVSMVSTGGRYFAAGSGSMAVSR